MVIEYSPLIITAITSLLILKPISFIAWTTVVYSLTNPAYINIIFKVPFFSYISLNRLKPLISTSCCVSNENFPINHNSHHKSVNFEANNLHWLDYSSLQLNRSCIYQHHLKVPFFSYISLYRLKPHINIVLCQ